MKTRNGFISNSSSTSFVVLLPKNFNREECLKETISNYRCIGDLLDAILDDEEFCEENNIQEGTDDLPEDTILAWLSKEIGSYIDNRRDIPEDENGATFDFAATAFKKYVICTIDTSSGCGEISFASLEKVKEILGINGEVSSEN